MKARVGRWLEGLIRVDIGLIAASTATLAAGFALTLSGADGIWRADAGLQTEPDIKFASADALTEGTAEPAADAACDSFDERFASAFGSSGHARGRVATVAERDNVQELDFEAPATDERLVTKAMVTPEQMTPMTRAPMTRAPMTPASITRGPMTPVPPRYTGAREGRLKTAEASVGLSLPPDSSGHTAIYDISARTVYLPDGTRLEAHSGLGSLLDDPRYIRTKMQGPTPPNVYRLTLRERLFHGVRAIRLVPADDGKMFGRDGILAHSYMLGPNGQSNGCVSFRDYPAFLNAFLKGEVDRLVVVEHLATTTGAKAASAAGG